MQNAAFERVNHNVSLVNDRKKYKGNTVVGESRSGFVGKFSANGVDIKVSLGDRVVPNYCIVSDMNLRTFHGLFFHVHFFYRRTFISPSLSPVILALLQASLSRTSCYKYPTQIFCILGGYVFVAVNPSIYKISNFPGWSIMI